MTQNALKALKNALKVNTKNCRIEENFAVSNNEMGSEVKKSVGRLELVHVSRNIRNIQRAAALPAFALREATTGRPVAVPRTIPRIMAVADPASASAPAPQPRPVSPRPKAEAVSPRPKAELAFYRKYTEAMLRRYTRISMQPGRTPSLLGRELFRGDSSHSTLTTFEDGVVFCLDVERCLARLSREDRRLIKRIAIQGHTPQEAAPLLGMCFRSCYTHYYKALDHLTEIFLAGRLLEPSKCCQDVEAVEN